MTIMIPTWVEDKLVPVEKLEAHQRGLRHKAISVFLIHEDQTLLQQRALGKYHTPGLWTNACCTHPFWDEAPELCAKRRLQEELGIHEIALEPRGVVEYRADVGNGLIEHEVVALFRGFVPHDLRMRLNPNEVSNTRWVSFEDLKSEIAREPQKFTPWLKIYLEEFLPQII